MRRSSNAGSCNCTRTASPRARSGRSATSRVPPCTGGCGGPQQRFDQGGRQPHAGAERADRVEGGATASWRWRWMFQNKRRRYSHESRGHTVRRRPLPDIGAVQDPGRCQVDLLLDARTPRGRTRRPPMRVTRSACGATAARSMGQEDQARPGACGHRHVAPPRQPDHEGRGHGGLVFEGPVPAASGQAERRSGPEHPRPRIRWLRPRTRTSPPAGSSDRCNT